MTVNTNTTAAFSGWNAWDDRDPNKRYAEDNALFATSYRGGPNYTPKLLRGYMRSANPDTFGRGRLFFQFNPNALLRHSQAQYDVYAAVSVSPADMQATNTTGFSFTLVFDRQGEVAAGISVDPRITRTVSDVTITDLGTAVGPGGGNPNLALNPFAGVLGDLAVLDKLVGIGDVSDTATKNPTINQTPFLAKPIRVIFSPQFMVEGFVETVDVTMDKFNVQMIPVTCTVQIGMIARYIGAATNNTGVQYGSNTAAVGSENPQFYPGNYGGAGPSSDQPASRGLPVVAAPTQRNYTLTPSRGPY